MAGPRHVFEIEVAAAPAAVWRALTDPEITQRYYFGCRFESALVAGAPYRYGSEQDPAEVGTVIAAEAPRRLELRGRFLFDPAAAKEAPHRVLWEVEPTGTGSRVRATCDDFRTDDSGGDTVASGIAAGGFPPLMKGLKLAAEGSGPARREKVGAPVVKALTKELLADWLRFFDGPAFADNPAWGICYCSVFHRAADETGDAAKNRAFSSDLVECGRMQGYLAYVDGEPAGWCNAAPRSSLEGFAKLPDLAVDDAERVGSIVCFVVAAPYRRHGVARALLAAALDGFAKKGLAFAEAYPGGKQAKTDAQAFRGPLALYQEAGFESFRDLGHTVIVRRALARP